MRSGETRRSFPRLLRMPLCGKSGRAKREAGRDDHTNRSLFPRRRCRRQYQRNYVFIRFIRAAHIYTNYGFLDFSSSASKYLRCAFRRIGISGNHIDFCFGVILCPIVSANLCASASLRKCTITCLALVKSSCTNSGIPRQCSRQSSPAISSVISV